MKKLTKFDVILNIWVSLIINIALSAVLPALNGFLTWGTFFSGFAIAFPVSTILVFVLPVVSWGAKFASLFKLKPNTPVFTVMTLLMTAINAGIGPHFLAAWWSCYLLALLTVYLSALLGLFTGLPLTKKILGIPAEA